MLLNRTQVIYRIRPAVRLDSYGDPVEDAANAERVRLGGAVVQSFSSTEDPDRAMSHKRQLFCPGALDLAAEDLIEVDGERWRVEGDVRIRHGLAVGILTTATLVRPERRYPQAPQEEP